MKNATTKPKRTRNRLGSRELVSLLRLCERQARTIRELEKAEKRFSDKAWNGKDPIDAINAEHFIAVRLYWENRRLKEKLKQANTGTQTCRTPDSAKPNL